MANKVEKEKSAKKLTLKEQAYNIIKDKIVNCDYPPNMILNEEMLKEDVDASRTPIRDALGRLEQENLVKILPKKGIMVAPVSLRDINMIHETRVLIEPYAILQYGNRISEQKYLKYKELFSHTYEEGVDSNRLYEYDNTMHQDFIDATDNEYIISIYDRIFCQNCRLRIISGVKSPNRLLETQREHMDIVLRCLEKDWQGAADAMAVHLENSKKAYYEAVFREADMAI